MRATLRQRKYVVNLLSRSKPAIPFTNLAQRVLCYVSVTDSFPRSSVPFLHLRRTVILLIALVFLLLMFLAEPSVCKARTSWVGTRSLRFIWHWLSPRFWVYKKPCKLYPARLSPFILLLHYTLYYMLELSSTIIFEHLLSSFGIFITDNALRCKRYMCGTLYFKSIAISSHDL